MIILPILLDDGILLQGVKYTDIDYDVFTDAARYTSNGQSPFMRHTYRYTPFLALILSYSEEDVHWFNWWRRERYFGRMLFCIADALCGWVILHLRRKARGKRQTTNDRNLAVELQDAAWWLYNPLPINICTRGSAESFVVLLSVLATVTIAMTKVKSNMVFRLNSILAGVVHGLAIHAKLYPIIYTASFMAYFAHEEDRRKVLALSSIDTTAASRDEKNESGWKCEMESIGRGKKQTETKMHGESRQYPFPWLQPRRLLQLVKLWIYRLLSPCSILFLTFSLATFGTLTYLAVHFYGQEALQEGLLYHFSRVDHRHNYSMFWYWIYLARARVVAIGGELASSSLSTLGRVLLLPQVVLLLYASLGIAPNDLTFALFVQTFFFVALNKVFTAQYFTWYLVVLPLCSDRVRWRSRDMMVALGLLGVAIVTWLGSAFCLEMKGMAVHLQVWMASIGFFIANVNLLRAILNNYQGFVSDHESLKDKEKIH